VTGIGALQLLDVVATCCLVMSLWFMLSYLIQRRRLRKFVRKIVPLAASPKEAAVLFGRFIFAHVNRREDTPYIGGLLAIFGAAPLSVLERGGCCSGTHRLFIAGLACIGIKAYQVTVYHRSGLTAHCLAGVLDNDREFLIDVDYGVLYQSENGADLSLSDLRGGVRPKFVPFASGLTALHAKPRIVRAPGYPDCPYYDFDFSETRTANWKTSPWRRGAYAVAKLISMGRVDVLPVPALLEWPQMLIALPVFCTALLSMALRVMLM
jgi:hypothetical protein